MAKTLITKPQVERDYFTVKKVNGEATFVDILGKQQDKLHTHHGPRGGDIRQTTKDAVKEPTS